MLYILFHMNKSEPGSNLSFTFCSTSLGVLISQPYLLFCNVIIMTFCIGKACVNKRPWQSLSRIWSGLHALRGWQLKSAPPRELINRWQEALADTRELQACSPACEAPCIPAALHRHSRSLSAAAAASHTLSLLIIQAEIILHHLLCHFAFC